MSGGGSFSNSLEVKFDADELAINENLANLYSLFVTTDFLEKAWVSGTVESEQYEAECKKLLTQFKTLRDSLTADFDIPAFLAKYGLNCPLASSRLIRDGVPATIKHGAARDDGAAAASERSVIFEVTSQLITTLDALGMNHLAVDLLQPGLERIMTGLHRIASLPADHAAKTQVLKWLQRLNVMRAQDELSPDDARQMVFDITQGYNALESFLKSGK